MGGITDLDAVRTTQGGTLSKAPYLARLMIHQIIPLSHERIDASRGPLAIFTSLPARRIELRAGKFSMADFFDNNSWASDSHLGFLNWTVDNNGAWDYPANTRGYTDGAVVEYDDHLWSVRFGEALMPKEANGIYLDADLARAHSETLEGEVRGDLIPKRAGVLRLLGYVNHANMGNYREAIEDFLDHSTSTPDVVATRMQGRTKAGLGVNFEQEFLKDVTLFGRYGWNDGRNESFAYTEVDSTVEIGAGVRGAAWRRKLDKAAAVFVSNGLSGDHREYLALGGEGFLLGDGRLNYRREDIVEAYYNIHFWRGIYGSPSLQFIENPGYNHDRGPVFVGSLRLHVDF